MTDDLEALKRITEYIRQARADLVEGLAELERSDLARVVPADYREQSHEPVR